MEVMAGMRVMGEVAGGPWAGWEEYGKAEGEVGRAAAEGEVM